MKSLALRHLAGIELVGLQFRCSAPTSQLIRSQFLSFKRKFVYAYSRARRKRNNKIAAFDSCNIIFICLLRIQTVFSFVIGQKLTHRVMCRIRKLTAAHVIDSIHDAINALARAMTLFSHDIENHCGFDSYFTAEIGMF